MAELARIDDFLVSFEIRGETLYLSTKKSRMVVDNPASIILHEVRRDEGGLLAAVLLAVLGGLLFGAGRVLGGTWILLGVLTLILAGLLAIYYGSRIGAITIETKNGNVIVLQVSWDMGTRLVTEFYSRGISRD